LIAQGQAVPVQSGSESLIEYPSEFPIKVMGARVDGFVDAVIEVARGFDPALDASRLELRESREGKYLGITLWITATSREQLDALYRALTAHPMVKFVL
jgi:putative lipoic acid-binding regulatory protein